MKIIYIAFILTMVLSISVWADTTYMVTNINDSIGVGPNADVRVAGINNNGQVVGNLNGETSFLWDKNSGYRVISDHGNVWGISDTGYIVGSFGVWKDGSIINIGTLGGAQTEVYAVSKSGKVAGNSQTATGQWNTFIWDQTGGMRDMGVINGDIVAVNDREEIAGMFWDSGWNMHSFLWNSTHGLIDIGTFGDGCYATGLNSYGQVTGSSGGSRDRALMWQDLNNNGYSDPEELLNLGTLGGLGSYGQGINDLGQVVGYFDVYNNSMLSHGFIWDELNGMVDLNSKLPADWEFYQAVGINNAGQIIGYASGSDFGAVMLSPIPEPCSLLILASGIFFFRRISH